IDPANDYAIGVRPLLEDRAVVCEQRTWHGPYSREQGRQLNAAEERKIPYEDIYPTQWPAVSSSRDRLVEEMGVGEADRAVQAALNRKQPQVRFERMAFEDVIDLLRDTTGLDIQVDWKQLQQAGIDPKAPVQARMRDVKLATLLDEVLRQVSTNPANKLVYTVDEDGITVSTVAGARSPKPSPFVTRANEELWIIGRVSSGEPRQSDDTPGSGQLAAKQTKDGKEQLIPVPLKHTDVKASIAAYISSTTVRQQFHNPYAQNIEAVYVFPLPENAAINEFVMTVGQRKIRGIIREREEAEQLYQEARSQGHVASLLTQERPNVFTQSVANIEPGKQIDIEITYYHTLAYTDGWYEWAFPMVVGPRYNPANSTQGVGAAPRGKPGITGQATEVQYLKPAERSGHDIGLSIELNCPAGIEEIRCTSHRINVDHSAPGRATITIASSDTLPNKDFVLRYRVAGGQIKSGMLVHRDQRGSYFNLMVYPPMELRQQDRTPLEMVFLLDVSGSMSGDPINQSKAAMRYALSHMSPGDTFQVITFSGSNRTLFDRAQPVTREATDRVMHFVEDSSAGGGTEMMPAITAALSAAQDPQHKRVVVFLTDGFVGNEDDILRAVHDRLGSARIFSFGVGSSPNRYLMDGLARIGHGTVAYLGLRDSGEDVMRLYFDRVA
ncbi:MAG TPA: VIT domain-containing protein, partial [Chloroflexota bacterium]|nr:VIT domain-containing protein [Chloroflexota bacterium]